AFIRKTFKATSSIKGQVELNPDLLNPKPNANKIKKLAQQISTTMHPTPEQLNWLIAERRLLYHTIKNLKDLGKIKLPLDKSRVQQVSALKAWQRKVAMEMRASFKKSVDRITEMMKKKKKEAI
nr:hypothetical protein [Candidatus Sigynarchaeota archaeon]